MPRRLAAPSTPSAPLTRADVATLLGQAAQHPDDRQHVEAALQPEVIDHLVASQDLSQVAQACALTERLPDVADRHEVLSELLTDNVVAALAALDRAGPLADVVSALTTMVDESPGHERWAASLLNDLLTDDSLRVIASSGDARHIGQALRGAASLGTHASPPTPPQPPPALPPALMAYLQALVPRGASQPSDGSEPLDLPPWEAPVAATAERPGPDRRAMALGLLLMHQGAADTLARSRDARLIGHALGAAQLLEPALRPEALACLMTRDATRTLAADGDAPGIDDAVACARCLPAEACATALGELLTPRALATLAASDRPDHIGHALAALDLLPDGGSRCAALLTDGAIDTVIGSHRAGLIGPAAFAASRLDGLGPLRHLVRQGGIEIVEVFRDPHAASLMALALTRLPDGERETALGALLTREMRSGLQACPDPVVHSRMATVTAAMRATAHSAGGVPEWARIGDGAAARGGSTASRTPGGPSPLS